MRNIRFGSRKPFLFTNDAWIFQSNALVGPAGPKLVGDQCEKSAETGRSGFMDAEWRKRVVEEQDPPSLCRVERYGPDAGNPKLGGVVIDFP